MSLAAPDKWYPTVGVLGTDFEREDTLSQTGNHTLHLKNTTAGTKLVSAWMPVRGGWNNTYSFWTIIRASSIAGTNTVTVKVQGYQRDRSTPTTAAYALNAATLNAANTWEYHGKDIQFAAATRWARFEVSKAAHAFNVYVDTIALEKFPPYCTLNGVGEAFASGASWLTPAMSTGVISECNNDPVNDRVIILVPGVYSYIGWAEVSGLSDGDYVEIRIHRISGVSTFNYYGVAYPTGAAGTVRLQVAYTRPLDSNDTLELQLRQQTGAGLTIEDAELNVARIGSPSG